MLFRSGFIYLLNPAGPLNRILGVLHLPEPLWFVDPRWTKPGLTLIGLWGIGQVMIIFLASLLDVPRQLYEAADLEGARPWQTFRHVTLPAMGTALVAGALLAFALSFDEIIVTTFTSGAATKTLPIWIFSNYSNRSALPLVNVAAILVLLVSVVPVYLAARLTRDPGAVGRT